MAALAQSLALLGLIIPMVEGFLLSAKSVTAAGRAKVGAGTEPRYP
jgi:hypothetical protein